jgi:hypothetical protein
MLTPTQLETATAPELKTLGNRIDRELALRELEKRESASSRPMVEEKSRSAGTLRLDMVKGGKDRCKKCAEGRAHAPYWYLYYGHNGKLTSHYVGRMSLTSSKREALSTKNRGDYYAPQEAKRSQGFWRRPFEG